MLCGLLGLSTIILTCLRRHAIAELACWLLLASSLYVGVRWYVYYQQALAHVPNMVAELAP